MRSDPASIAARRLLASLLPLLAFLGCKESDPIQVVAPGPDFAIGINLAEPSYFGTETPFVDLFKLAGPWVTQCDGQSDPACRPDRFARQGASAWDTREQDRLDLDSSGYPLRFPVATERAASGVAFSSIATLVPTGLARSQPFGRFTVLYDGEGTIEYGRGAVRNEASSKVGRDVVDVRVDGDQGWFQLAVRATDPQRRENPIRNIRVLPEGGVCGGRPAEYCRPDEAGAGCSNGEACQTFTETSVPPVFDPRFLAYLQPFAAVRFMGFQNTNNALTENWSQRTLPDRVFVTAERGDGVPIETIAVLGNQLGVDVWVNMPTRADDEYVRQFASLLKARLDSGRHVYVEYSNEVWNDAFGAGKWIQEQAERRWPGGSVTPFDKRLQWFGMRTAQICDIWEDVWAGESGRVFCVMGAQAANAWTGAQALDCPLWAAEQGGIPCYRHHVDGLAIAPYFGFYIGSPEHAEILHSWTALPDRGLSHLFAEIFQGGQFPDSPPGGALRQARGFIEKSLVEARKRDLRLVGYEGGQHLVGVGPTLQDQAVSDLFIAANRDLRMGLAYQAHLADWRESGGGLYNLWNSVSPYSGWGSWGLLEYRDQGHSAKYDAVVRFIEESSGGIAHKP
jgi:hypothetical protein